VFVLDSKFEDFGKGENDLLNNPQKMKHDIGRKQFLGLIMLPGLNESKKEECHGGFCIGL